jgi:hypothetical protein
MPTKTDCIAAVSRAANVPAEQAASIVDFVLKERRRLKAAGQLANLEGSLARSLMNMAEAERVSLARERRNTALTIVKRQRLAERTTALQGEGLSFDRALTTLLWGDRSRAAGARDSAARRMDALRALWRGELARELDAIPGLAEAIKNDAALDSAIRREMIEPGSTGDATAARAAGVFGNLLEAIRTTLNDAGANIGRLPGYAPQNHSAKKLLKAERQTWVARMLDALNWERTMVDVAPERRAEVLGELWTSIVTGQKPVAREVSANPFRKPRNMASGFEHERALHFKDAETAAAYHKDFGEGTVLDAVLSRVERGSRSAGMMEVFGPNPETMIESLFTEERLRLRNMTPDEIRRLASGEREKKLAALEKKAAAGDANAAHEWDRAIETLRAENISRIGKFNVGDRKGEAGLALRVLMGETGAAETPTGAKIARAMRAVRQVNSSSLLGSAMMAAIGDIQTKALWFRHGGESVFDSVRRAFGMALEGAQPAEKKEIGRALGFYADKMLGDFHSRFSEGDAAPGWLARNVNNLFKISGLNAWTEAHKAAAGFYLSNRMGENAKAAFADLNPHYAATLRRAGLEDRWPLIRKLAAKEADGNIYVLPENARNLTDADLEPHLPERLREALRPSDAEKAENFEAARQREMDRLRAGLELDLLGYIHDEVGYAVIEPDARTTAVQTQGLAPGTFKGEVARSVMQFKSFPVAYFQRILMEQRWLRAADTGVFNHAGGMAFAVAACAAMGYVSITARDLSRGKEPRDPRKLETVFASLVQGGGLSIVGDFFLGKLNRWGGGMAETAMGPTLGAAFSLATAGNTALHGEGVQARDNLLGQSRMPYANLWWAKAALDYGVNFHIREWLSPGSLARSEAALKRDFNQKYLKIGGLDFAPTAHIKRGSR